MADTRIHQVAVQLGHVYYSRESELNRATHEYSPEELKTMRFEDFKRTMVGGANPRKFLDTFFPVWAPILGKFGEGGIIRTYGAVPPTTPLKHCIVDPLVKILNHQTALLRLRHSGDIVFCDRAKLSKSKKTQMPDIVAVNERFQFVVDESKTSEEPLEIDDMGLAEYFVTVHPDREGDFFHDPTPGMEQFYDPKKPTIDTHFTLLDHIYDPEERKEARGRLDEMIERVADVWNQQWRSHIFTISMAGSMVRFLRWDRGGTFITTAFDIRKEPGLLVDFLRLYYQSSKEVRGFLVMFHWTVKDEPGESGKEQEGGSNRKVGIGLTL